MIPLRLELSNFLPYRDPAPLDFTGLHVACLAGENGAGKSALLDAITWALWGKARVNSADLLIHQGETEMRVAFTFDLGHQTYQVLRQRKAGRPGQTLLDLQMLDDGRWRGMSEDTITKTQRKITRLLRLDYETFINSAFLMQGRADAFTVKTPAERKQVLADILGLEQWEQYEQRARECAVKAEESIVALDRRVAELEAELARKNEYEAELAATQARAGALAEQVSAAERDWHDLEQARQMLVTLQRQIDDFTRSIVRSEKELAEANLELAAAQARADSAALTVELDAAQKALAALDAREAEREQAAAARQDLAATAAELRGANEAMHAEAETLKGRITALKAATEPTCPTCGQPLAEADHDRLVGELQAEVAARRARYRENKTQVDGMTAETGALDRTLATMTAELRERPAWQRKLAELQAALAGVAEAREAVGRVEARRQRYKLAIAEDRGGRERLEAQALQIETEVRAAGDKQAELERLRLDHRIAVERVGAARQRLSSLDNLARQREARLAERAQRAEEQGIYIELREAFGKRGVPAMIIEAAIPEIEDEANVLLSRMTGSRMHVRFDTQKETQKGDLTETLDIRIADELGTRPYENYSGGEQTRVNFAVRVALSKLLARRAGAQLQTLVVDEGFGALDAAGRERLVEAIHAVQDDFERILVITHLDELKDVFPVRIDVTKTERGSQIAII